MKPSKNLLIIAYYFPPMGTVAFLRNYHIAKYLSPIFDSSHLITIKNVSISLKDPIPKDFIEEHRVFNFDYRNLTNLLSSNINLRERTNAKSKTWRVKLIRKIFDSFPINTIFGEGGLLYIINGTLRGIKLVRKNKISHVYSSFRPISDHVIAFNLKLLFPSLIWISDFRDPPVSKNANAGLFYKFQWWFIKTIISKVDIVTTVSDGIADIIKSVRKDIYTLRNGIYDLFEQKPKEKYEKFTLSFTGSIYPRLQKPEILFQSLSSLLKDNRIAKEDFQLIYAGKDAGIWNDLIEKFSLGDISINEYEVPLYDSIKIQKKSHISIIFSWSEEYKKGILTGKLYEYLATGNPIFSFINGNVDNEFETVFDNINAGFVFYNNDIDEISDTISKFYNQWKISRSFDFSYDKIEIEKYTWENRIKQLVGLINGLK